MVLSRNFLIDIFTVQILDNFQSIPFYFLFFIFFALTTLSSLFFINYLGLYGVFVINFIALGSFWIIYSLYFSILFTTDTYYYINLGSWIYLSSDYHIDFEFLFDTISFAFSYLTLTIGFFVYIYSFSYFRYEPLVDRLLILLNSFMISMIVLVTAGNLVVLFLGWELIGLTSFFLINFWTTRINTFKSAFKAFSFNKLSDFFLLLAIILIYNVFSTLDILSINTMVLVYLNNHIVLFETNLNYINLICLCFLGSAFIKSAQFGFHIWLPDSMEAPVPASALIHSATLVSAGIFLILRFYPLFELVLWAKILMILIGSFTAFYGGWVAAVQTDIKRLLAYSTISHCGFLMCLCGLNMVPYVLLYLYVHGFFKALVFMCAGNVIRFAKNIQDYRRMGNFSKYLPFECTTSFICLINLAGLPGTYGFFIKHTLFLVLLNNSYYYYISFILIFLAAFSGIFYAIGFFYNIFFDKKKARKHVYFDKQRKILCSNFYTNSSIASSIAISALLIISMIVCAVLIFNIYNTNDIFIVTYSYFINNNSYLLNLQNNFTLQFILTYFNWIGIVLLILFSLLIDRAFFKAFRIYSSILILSFVIFFFFFISLI